MVDTKHSQQLDPASSPLDEFVDVESEMDSSREHIRSLGLLLSGFAIIAAIFAIGCLLG